MIRRLLIALVLIGISSQGHASSNGILAQGLSSSTTNGYVSPAQRLPSANDDWTQAYYGDGSVSNLLVTTQGTTCTVTPTLTIGAPATGGINATGHFVMNGQSTFAAVIDIPGRGYTADPTVTISAPSCGAAPVVQAYYNPQGNLWYYDGRVYQAHQTDVGQAVWSFVPTPSKPLDSVVNGVTAATVSGGSGGTGYATNDTITIASGTVLKVTAQSGGVITTVSVLTAGNWQCNTTTAQPQISTSGTGTGATFVLTANWAQGAYGDHILTACYTANKYADITRASDSTTATIGFVNGVADISSMQNFCAGTTCTWAKVYDQSGYQHDAPAGATAPILDFGQNLNGFPLWYAGSFTLPAGVAFNDASFSSYLLSRSNTGAAGNFMFQAGMSINGFCGVATGACINFKTPSNGFNFFSSYALTYAPDLIGGTLSSTTTGTYSVSDFDFPSHGSTISNGANLTGGTIGATSNSGLDGDMFVLWPRAFSNNERTSFKAAVYATYKLSPQIRDSVQTAGDSRTSGVNSTNGVDYPVQIIPFLKNNARVISTGVNGYQLQSGIIANCFTGYGDCVLMAQPHGKNAWVELWIGYNDFTTGGISAATLETSLASFVSTVHSLGWKIQVVVDPDVASYTSMFLANAYGADSVCNYLSDPVWTTATDWTLQPFQNFPHPFTFGYGYVANDTANCLNPLWKVAY